MKPFNIVIICVFCNLAGLAIAQSAKLYRWVDEDGIVHFGDSVPQEYSELELQVVNEHGITVEVIPAKKTAEDLLTEAERQQLNQDRELDRRREQTLLATYLTVEDIQIHRDRRVELFQAQARVTELHLSNLKRRMGDLLEEATKFKPNNSEPTAPTISNELSEDIKTTQTTIARHEENLEKLAADQQAIIDLFDSDIDRFKQLKDLN